MAFVYVDKIVEINPRKSIRGFKLATRNEPFYYWLPNGKRVLSPAVLMESMAQLGAWLNIHMYDFKKRPVLLTDDHTEYFDYVVAGDCLDLRVDILEDRDDDVVVTTGKAFVGEKMVAYSKCTRGYMLPMSDFASEEIVKKRFEHVFKNELEVPKLVDEVIYDLKPYAGGYSFDTLRLIDGILTHEYGKKVRSYKNITSCEPYFQEHFPHKPVVPGVVLMSFAGETCQYLIKKDLAGPLRSKALIPAKITDLRFRKFVEPGNQCVVDVEIIEGDINKSDSMITTMVKIFSNNQRVMQGKMHFKTMFN